MTTLKPISVLVALLFIGCDTFAVRKIGSCVTSDKFGGPYRIIDGTPDELEFKNEAGEKVIFPNDYSWKSVICE